MTEGAAGPSAAASGRQRRLLRLAGPRGVIAGIAIDHRDSLNATLERRGLPPRTVTDLRGLKLRLVRALAPAATAVMLDEELGGLALDVAAVPPSVGLVMPLEAQGYEAAGDSRTTTLMDDFGPADALRRGADAAKLLVPYRVDDAASAGRQDAVIAAAITACHGLGLPLIVEPLVYRWSTESPAEYGERYPGLVLGAVRRIRPLGPDLLKLPFPILDLDPAGEPDALAACRALGDACSGTPWVLLGAGAETSVFVEQVRLAGTAGASGFLAGRGIWGAALAAGADAGRVAATVCRTDLERCRTTAERFARSLSAASASDMPASAVPGPTAG